MLDELIAIAGQMAALRSRCSECPYIGSYDASVPLKEEAIRLRHSADSVIATIVSDHPDSDTREKMRSTDSTLDEDYRSICARVDSRPRGEFQWTEAEMRCLLTP